MAQQQTINYGEIISAVVKADNSLDTSRDCDMRAQVRISQGRVESVEQGTLTKEGQLLADFSSYTEGQLSINFQPTEGGTDTLYQSITQFIAKLRETAAQAAKALAIGDTAMLLPWQEKPVPVSKAQLLTWIAQMVEEG